MDYLSFLLIVPLLDSLLFGILSSLLNSFPSLFFSFSFSYPAYTLEHNLVRVEMDSVLSIIYLWHQKENIQGVKN